MHVIVINTEGSGKAILVNGSVLTKYTIGKNLVKNTLEVDNSKPLYLVPGQVIEVDKVYIEDGTLYMTRDIKELMIVPDMETAMYVIENGPIVEEAC